MCLNVNCQHRDWAGLGRIDTNYYADFLGRIALSVNLLEGNVGIIKMSA